MMYVCRNFYFMLDSYPVVNKTRTSNKQTAPLGIGSRCAAMHRLENYKACKETSVITEQTPRSEMPLAKPRTKTDRKNTNTLGKQHHSSPKSTYHPHCLAPLLRTPSLVVHCLYNSRGQNIARPVAHGVGEPTACYSLQKITTAVHNFILSFLLFCFVLFVCFSPVARSFISFVGWLSAAWLVA